ncbi:MAG: sugar kinase, partial [Planctomycetes bacterium]|nr:sugar kinase [Planctomycetota bacterium]
MPLLVVGSIAIDTIRTPDGKEHADVLGGSCTYFSYSASFMTKVQVVGIVGEDFEQKHIDLLKSREIDLDGLEVMKGGKTFRWAGTYAENTNDRTTDDLQFGVLEQFNPVLPDNYKDTPFVFLACAAPELQLKVMDQLEGKPFVVCDTIEFYIENMRDKLGEVFKRCDGIIINDSEVKLLTGDSNLVRASDKILAMGPKFAVLKKGEHGGILATKEGIFPFPAYPLKEVKDPTGAGDSF